MRQRACSSWRVTRYLVWTVLAAAVSVAAAAAAAQQNVAPMHCSSTKAARFNFFPDGRRNEPSGWTQAAQQQAGNFCNGQLLPVALYGSPKPLLHFQLQHELLNVGSVVKLLPWHADKAAAAAAAAAPGSQVSSAVSPAVGTAAAAASGLRTRAGAAAAVAAAGAPPGPAAEQQQQQQQHLHGNSMQRTLLGWHRTGSGQLQQQRQGHKAAKAAHLAQAQSELVDDRFLVPHKELELSPDADSSSSSSSTGPVHQTHSSLVDPRFVGSSHNELHVNEDAQLRALLVNEPQQQAPPVDMLAAVQGNTRSSSSSSSSSSNNSNRTRGNWLTEAARRQQQGSTVAQTQSDLVDSSVLDKGRWPGLSWHNGDASTSAVKQTHGTLMRPVYMDGTIPVPQAPYADGGAGSSGSSGSSGSRGSGGSSSSGGSGSGGSGSGGSGSGSSTGGSAGGGGSSGSRGGFRLQDFIRALLRLPLLLQRTKSEYAPAPVVGAAQQHAANVAIASVSNAINVTRIGGSNSTNSTNSTSTSSRSSSSVKVTGGAMDPVGRPAADVPHSSAVAANNNKNSNSTNSTNSSPRPSPSPSVKPSPSPSRSPQATQKNTSTSTSTNTTSRDNISSRWRRRRAALRDSSAGRIGIASLFRPIAVAFDGGQKTDVPAPQAAAREPAGQPVADKPLSVWTVATPASYVYSVYINEQLWYTSGVQRPAGTNHNSSSGGSGSSGRNGGSNGGSSGGSSGSSSPAVSVVDFRGNVSAGRRDLFDASIFRDGINTMVIDVTVLEDSAVLGDGTTTIKAPPSNETLKSPEIDFYFFMYGNATLDSRPSADVDIESCRPEAAIRFSNASPTPVLIDGFRLTYTPVVERTSAFFLPVYYVYGTFQKGLDGSTDLHTDNTEGNIKSFGLYITRMPGSPANFTFSGPQLDGLKEGWWQFTVEGSLWVPLPHLASLLSLSGVDRYGNRDVMYRQVQRDGTIADGISLLNSIKGAGWVLPGYDKWQVGLQKAATTLDYFEGPSAPLVLGDKATFSWQFTGMQSGHTNCTIEGGSTVSLSGPCSSPLTYTVRTTLNQTLTISYRDVCRASHSASLTFGPGFGWKVESGEAGLDTVQKLASSGGNPVLLVKTNSAQGRGSPNMLGALLPRLVAALAAVVLSYAAL